MVIGAPDHGWAAQLWGWNRSTRALLPAGLWVTPPSMDRPLSERRCRVAKDRRALAWELVVTFVIWVLFVVDGALIGLVVHDAGLIR
jgi:hypothetical protein